MVKLLASRPETGGQPRILGSFSPISNITQILTQKEQGDLTAWHQQLPLVSEELRELAFSKLASERSRQKFQATALVHEAFLRLVHVDSLHLWKTCCHPQW